MKVDAESVWATAGDVNDAASDSARRAARGAGCQSMPSAALVGKISDLITTGTAPEFGSMAPMSM